MQSGIVCVERHWSYFGSVFLAQQRSLSQPTFQLLADLAFLRLVWMDFNKPWQAPWTRGDLVLAQKATELGNLLDAAANGDLAPLLAELIEVFK